MKTIYTSKEINQNYYMVLGIDDNYPVLYVYKDDDLFDWHISTGSTFEAEMSNTINCFMTVHETDPSLEDILIWRSWFKLLKENNIIG